MTQHCHSALDTESRACPDENWDVNALSVKFKNCYEKTISVFSSLELVYNQFQYF